MKPIRDDAPQTNPTHFQWITEDEEWEDAAERAPRSPTRRPRWIPALFLLAALLLGGFLLRQRLLNEVDATTAAVAEDVLAANALVDRAAAQRDSDLLVSALSGIDDSWANAQRRRTDRGLLLENPYLGLTLRETAPLIRSHVTVDPDFRRALLEVPRMYEIRNADGETQRVTLIEPRIYRLGRERWLLAPPTEEDWGAEQTEQYARLTLTYPERDAETVARLGPLLDQRIAATCSALQCPPGRRFEIRFGTDPALHLTLTDPESIYQSKSPLTLPTPSLVGLPRDVAGMDALVGLYLPPIVNGAVVTGAPCCDHGLFAQAIRDFLLHVLEIRAYPLRASDRYRLLDKPREPDEYSGAWTASADPLLEKQSWPAVYAVVAFGLKGKAPDEILAVLRSVRAQTNLDQFFLSAAGHPADTVVNAWYNFLSAPPQSTRQEVALICRREESDPANLSLLYRFTPGAVSTLTLEERFPGDIYASPAQHGHALILSERTSYRMFENRLLLWRPTGITVVVDPNRGDTVASYTRDMDPTEERLILARTDAPTSVIDGRSFALLDVTTCRDGSCPLQPLEWYPYWSPEGTSTLGFEFDTQTRASVWRGNAEGRAAEPLEDDVQWAFWIDDSTVGLVDDAGIYELRDDGEPVEIVPLDAIWAELDNDRLLRSTRRNMVMDVIVSQAAPDQLFVHVFDATQLRHGVLRVSRSDGSVNLEVTSTGRWIEVDHSENGRWLSVAGYEGGRTPQLTLISTTGVNPRRELSLPTGNFDWSATGARVVTPLGDNIRVTDLETGSNTVYPFDPALECSQTIWLSADRPLESNASQIFVP